MGGEFVFPAMGGEYEGTPTMGGEFVFPMMGREFLGIFPYDGKGVPKRSPPNGKA